jgi:hypothetical protein
MQKKSIIVALFVFLVAAAPLCGAYLSGEEASLFATFPPLTHAVEHPPFSWPVFLLYSVPALVCLLCIGLIFSAAWSKPSTPVSKAAATRGKFPWWGWAALVLLGLAWMLAWTRFDWFAPVQRHTFIPLWFSSIIVANALCLRLSGSSPLLHQPRFFWSLFPLSAVFWWFFEYLNQFVNNWYYVGVDYGALAYSVHATISFSTVLPAVYTTMVLLANFRWFSCRAMDVPPLQRNVPVHLSLAYTVPALALSFAGLAAMGLWPEQLFSLVWLAPLVMLWSLKHMAGLPTLLQKALHGNLRPLLSAALAALICGFFWEMWNYCSMAKWMYSIPYVQRFALFEMPVLGYMGYLPFGVLCIEIVELLRNEKHERGSKLP